MSQPFIPHILKATAFFTFAVSVCHGASILTGSGAMSVGGGPVPFDISTDYDKNAQSGESLVISRTEFYQSSANVMHYDGIAKFGRLATRASVGSTTINDEYTPLYSSSLSVGFQDTITVSNLASGWLALEFDIHGVMDNGAYAVGADFGVLYGDNGDTAMEYSANIVNAANTPQISGSGLQIQPGQGVRFVQDGHEWVLLGNGRVWVPFGPDGVSLFVAMRARASCYEGHTCESDLGSTATIGNIQVYDQSLQLVAHAVVQSESGYNYLTPPGGDTAAIPEPSTVALLAGGIASLLLLGARRRRS